MDYPSRKINNHELLNKEVNHIFYCRRIDFNISTKDFIGDISGIIKKSTTDYMDGLYIKQVLNYYLLNKNNAYIGATIK